MHLEWLTVSYRCSHPTRIRRHLRLVPDFRLIIVLLRQHFVLHQNCTLILLKFRGYSSLNLKALAKSKNVEIKAYHNLLMTKKVTN